jgi:hypothetical protein
MRPARLLVASLTIYCATIAVLSAQPGQESDVAPLRNWAAPLYWQPTDAETRATNPTAAAKSRDTAAAIVPIGSNALVFVAMTPCRVVDTRPSSGFTGSFGPPSLAPPNNARAISMKTSPNCPIHPLAQAYSLNVTVVPPAPLGYLTVWPDGQPRPVVSTLNALQGQIVANAAIVPAGTQGYIDVYASSNTDLIIDINGYYAPPSDLDANTGVGMGALLNNISGQGQYNTAMGGSALYYNTAGSENTSIGWTSMFQNTTGSHNTAIGAKALRDNTTGAENTATGEEALRLNQTGSSNTANGFEALFSNVSGSENTAFGHGALQSNTAGPNTAHGFSALLNTTTGQYNTAIGHAALVNNQHGSGNIAIGDGAGGFVQGDSNIDIGNIGASTDTGVIRIGGINNVETHISGIWTRTTSGGALPVVVDNFNQLGTMSSSRRYKEDISDMSEASADLMRLHPVTFRYKKPYADGSKPIDYGLIAEEVAEVYPDLVVRGAEGQIESVQYQKLTPMLLNEVQKLRAEMNELRRLMMSLSERPGLQ